MVSPAIGPIAAIGNFDGVHKGHRRLLAKTVDFARARRAAPAAVVFDPHPRRFFRPDDPPFLLTTPSRRNRLLQEAGAEEVFPLVFDAGLAALTPEAFVADVLKARLRLGGVVTGTEFRFGKERAGDAAALKALCAAVGLLVLLVEPKAERHDGLKIGSSEIRDAIANGAVKEAALMLGRRWSVEGVVAEGQRLGRTLGFPTANLVLGELIEPRRGVYAVEVFARGGRHGGVANFGRRPTVGADTLLLETHLFDFDGDLYGERIEVAFVDFIRDERKFDGLASLQAQIAADARAARRILKA
jgi:riboflavin kinase/FMN adenylyltransferase